MRALDRHALHDTIGFPRGIDVGRSDLTVQKISALGRLALLARHGGVWTDATVACTRPLGEWLHEYYQAEFFAFRWPGRDRMMSNWFMATEPGNVIVSRLYRDFTALFANHGFENQGTPRGRETLARYAPEWNKDARSTLEWLSPFALDELRVYPYFIFHYTFNRLMLTDPECAATWNGAKPFSADPPHRLQSFATRENGIDLARHEIDAGECPMYKLNWRDDATSAYWSAVLRHLDALP